MRFPEAVDFIGGDWSSLRPNVMQGISARMRLDVRAAMQSIRLVEGARNDEFFGKGDGVTGSGGFKAGQSGTTLGAVEEPFGRVAFVLPIWRCLQGATIGGGLGFQEAYGGSVAEIATVGAQADTAGGRWRGYWAARKKGGKSR